MNQDFIVYIIVALAAAYLVRTWWQTARGRAGCGSCPSGGGCGKVAGSMRSGGAARERPSTSAESGLIQINLNGGSINLNAGSRSSGAPARSAPEAVARTPLRDEQP